MRPLLRRSARVSACAAAALVGWHRLNDVWRTVEAAAVAGAASVGPGSVEWAGGDQLWVAGDATPFVVVVGPWCSSAGPALAVIAVCAAFARTTATIRAAALASTVLFVGNLVRMVAVVVIGARSGAADLQLAHDGWATWWAVSVVLGAAAIVAAAFRGHQHPVTPAPVLEGATSR